VVAILGFVWSKKLSQQKSARAQSLCTFVISIVIGVTGAYFVYNGLERLLYPLPVAYSKKYAIVIASTILVKIFMGLLYIKANKKAPTPVFKAMVLDSFLDCAVTLFALMGLFLITKLNFSIDGIFAIIVGIFVTVSAVKNIIEQTKFLINN
jgi:divalent metal cation (Fe/Co/Zn/Cd) transporter